MPIDPSISDMPWLAQGGYDPRPLAAGAAVGAHVAQQRMQNASLAQRAQEFQAEQGLRERQVAVELAQAPLKQTLLEQDAALNAGKLQILLQARANEAKATQAYAGLAGQVDLLVEAGKIEEAQNVIIGAAARNGYLAADARTKALFDFTVKSQESKLALAAARGGGPFTPTITTLTDPTNGKLIPVVQTGPHQAQVLDPEKDALTKRGLDLRAQRIQQDLPPAAKSELKDIYDQIKSKREKLDSLPEMTGMVWNRQPNPKRAALQAEIDTLKAKADSLGKGAGSTPAAKTDFELGKTYTDAQGNKAIYRGDGNWTPLP